MPSPRCAGYIITVNNYTADEVTIFNGLIGPVNNRTRVTFIAYQFEVGESGTPHIQGYMQLSNKMQAGAFTDWLAAKLGRRPHVEAQRGTSEQAVDYCSKEDTRAPNTVPVVLGDYRVVPGLGSSNQGQRTDLIDVQQDIEHGMSLEELVNKHFSAFAKYDRFLRQYYTDFHQRAITQTLISETSGISLRSWQTELMTLVAQPPVPRRVSWWWERRGNVGKSFMARHLALHCDAIVCQMMKKSDLLHMLSKTIATRKSVVFDLTRSCEAGAVSVVYEVLEMLSNGYICSGKYDSQNLWVGPLHLIVFANFEPDRSAMSEDRWDVHHIASL
jgi:hypothetical protein